MNALHQLSKKTQIYQKKCANPGLEDILNGLYKFYELCERAPCECYSQQNEQERYALSGRCERCERNEALQREAWFELCKACEQHDLRRRAALVPLIHGLAALVHHAWHAPDGVLNTALGDWFKQDFLEIAEIEAQESEGAAA